MGIFGRSKTESQQQGQQQSSESHEITALPPLPAGSRSSFLSRPTSFSSIRRSQSLRGESPRPLQKVHFHSRHASGRTTPNASASPTPTPGNRKGVPDIPLRTSSRQVGLESSPEPWWTQDSLGRIVFGTRKLRSSSSKVSLSSLQTGTTADDGQRKQSRRTKSQSTAKALYFQHMAHIKPEEFIRLANTDEDDLAASFSAMRAAQSLRRDLRGIKTVDLHSRNSSIETATTSPSLSNRSSSARETPSTSCESSARTSVQSVDPTVSFKHVKSHVRAQRSHDSFSQPFTHGRPFKPVAPPRTSSRQATGRYDSDSTTLASLTWSHSPSHSIEEVDESVAWESNSKREPPVAERMNASQILHSPPRLSDRQIGGSWPLSLNAETSNHADSGGERPGTAHKKQRSVSRSPGKPPKSPLPPIPNQSKTSSTSHSAASSESSSEESSRTMTPVSYAEGLRKTPKSDDRTTPSSSSHQQSLKVQRASMQRSSISNGLFTGWAIDDNEEPCLPPVLPSQTADAKSVEVRSLYSSDPSRLKPASSDSATVVSETRNTSSPSPSGLKSLTPRSSALNPTRNTLRSGSGSIKTSDAVLKTHPSNNTPSSSIRAPSAIPRRVNPAREGKVASSHKAQAASMSASEPRSKVPIPSSSKESKIKKPHKKHGSVA